MEDRTPVRESRATAAVKRSRAITELLPAAIFGVLAWGTVAIALRMPIRELRWLPAIAGGVGFCVSYVAAKLWWRGRNDKIRFGLRTLLAVPVLVGTLLATFHYLRDWRMHRPQYQEYDEQHYQAAYEDFIDRIRSGQLDAAYNATSGVFKQHMTREQFHDVFRRCPELLGGEENKVVSQGGGSSSGGLHNSANYRVIYQSRNPDGGHVGLWIWVVMRDSLFHRRPPRPQVEEIAVQEIDSWPHVKNWPQPSWQDW